MQKLRIWAAAAAPFVLAAPAAMADSSTVQFSMTSDMESLNDASQNDVFNVALTDAQVVTKIAITCSAGSSKLFGLVRTDEACATAGNGSLINPSDPTKQLPRVLYSGDYDVKPTGLTDGKTLQVAYQAVGNVPATAATFGGDMKLKPQDPAPSATAIRDSFLKTIGVGAQAGSVIDDRIDTVRLDQFCTPSAGLPSDHGTCWSGDMVYTYQNSSWLIKVTGSFGGKDYVLTGNMPWIDVDTSKGTATYTLNITLPSAAAQSDAALFAASSDDALFAQADGISGTLNISQNDPVTVQVEGKPEDLYVRVAVTGTLTGSNVPLPVVRSFATVLGLLSRTFYGA